MSVRKYSLALVLALLGVATAAQAADKPTDPQIAHIAYTAGRSTSTPPNSRWRRRRMPKSGISPS